MGREAGARTSGAHQGWTGGAIMAAAICGIGRRIVGGIGKTSAGVIGRALVRARGTAAGGTAAVGETASDRRQGDAGRIAGAAHLQCADGAGLPIGDGWVGVEMASAEGAATRAAMRLLQNAEADLRQVVADDRRSERVRGGSGLGMRATETGVDSEAGAKVEAGLRAGRKGLPVSSRAQVAKWMAALGLKVMQSIAQERKAQGLKGPQRSRRRKGMKRRGTRLSVKRTRGGNAKKSLAPQRLAAASRSRARAKRRQ